MSERKYLVTGASGDTGRYATETLLKQSLPVRALVRRNGERAAMLRAAGIEVAVGDLLDLDQVREALEGTSGAYFRLSDRTWADRCDGVLCASRQGGGCWRYREHVSNFRP